MFLLQKKSVLFAIGGVGYGLLEILWRGKTHWSMVLTGGGCFLSLIKLFEKTARLPTALKCVAGSAVITAEEFVSGCIFNRALKLNVWDYSHNRFNYKGQICLLYSTLWGLLCLPVQKLCKALSGRT